MNRLLSFFLVAIFSSFVGTQITEGFLLLPHWKTLPTAGFYAHYAEFGPGIGQFYTILTITAAVIPLFIAVYSFRKKSPALKFAIVSTVLTIAFVAFFYIYFKGANQQFMDAALDADQLAAELIIWGNWHWARVAVEGLALVFLVLSLNLLTGSKPQHQYN